jgi:hypothetical protein
LSRIRRRAWEYVPMTAVAHRSISAHRQALRTRRVSDGFRWHRFRASNAAAVHAKKAGVGPALLDAGNTPLLIRRG